MKLVVWTWLWSTFVRLAWFWRRFCCCCCCCFLFVFVFVLVLVWFSCVRVCVLACVRVCVGFVCSFLLVDFYCLCLFVSSFFIVFVNLHSVSQRLWIRQNNFLCQEQKIKHFKGKQLQARSNGNGSTCLAGNRPGGIDLIAQNKSLSALPPGKVLVRVKIWGP